MSSPSSATAKFQAMSFLVKPVFIVLSPVIIFNSHNKLFQYASTDMDRVSDSALVIKLGD